jgi:hypothetical protein
MKSESYFVEHAAKEALSTPYTTGDAEADHLLAEARRHIYYWPTNFGGFEARVSLVEDQHRYDGSLKARSAREIELNVDSLEDKRWYLFQIEELVAHRESPDVSKMALKTGCRLGDNDQAYGQQVFLLGDKMESFYRVRDNKLTQIGRNYKNQKLRIHIEQHVEWSNRFISSVYNAFYFDLVENSLVKVETYLDTYQNIEGLALPLARRVTAVEKGQCKTRTIELSEMALIK